MKDLALLKEALSEGCKTVSDFAAYLRGKRNV